MIESTTIVSRNEWHYVAELQLDFDWSLPPVPLRRSEFGQVLLTLIFNAARAVSNSLPPNWSEKGKIIIATKGPADSAEVRVSDSGTGSTVIVNLPLAAA